MYVVDETNSGICDSTSYRIHSTLTECSIQTLAIHDQVRRNLVKGIYFKENNAHISGSTLFGGLLDRCTVSPFAEAYPSFINGVTCIHNISTLNTQSISSHPVRVCFWRDGQPDYNSQTFHVKVKKGEVFMVPLVAVDQVNHTINATIYSSLSSNLGGLCEDQSSQNLTESCTNVTFSVFSPLESIYKINSVCKRSM